ncbi:hypothetical protein PPYR_02409 [Photinus pyralis]|uniref:Uncharacterized protein n=1 Tax=Photinus pyralis TaxID=7054 RepID=A0A5N4B757_PHOPY|nr:hypothetical protein PPYR_02409 [Photinus pyralis]
MQIVQHAVKIATMKKDLCSKRFIDQDLRANNEGAENEVKEMITFEELKEHLQDEPSYMTLSQMLIEEEQKNILEEACNVIIKVSSAPSFIPTTSTSSTIANSVSEDIAVAGYMDCQLKSDLGKFFGEAQLQ